jgi:sterol desaturase/sphingolipid hydroxylase (fatty acid hydroxylase superfamily)
VNQTRIGYYAELFVYPIVVGGLLLYDVDGSGFALHLRWWFAAVCGAMLWTLAEYLVHRFVYHKVPILRELHGMHHSRPCDFIGAPIWVSILSFSSVFFLLALLWDLEIASGTTSGLIVGYVSYLLIHDAVHRWRLDEKSWVRGHRLRHLHHHRHPLPANFGVTTGVWDVVFGTAIVPERTARAEKPREHNQLPEPAA